MASACGPLPSWWAKSMLLAVILIVLAPDHWHLPVPLLDNREHAAQSESDEADEHGRHCHADVATCTDVPLASATGLAFLAAWLAFGVSAGGRWLRLGRGPAILRGTAVSVEIPPPRSPAYATG